MVATFRAEQRALKCIGSQGGDTWEPKCPSRAGRGAWGIRLQRNAKCGLCNLSNVIFIFLRPIC